MSENPITNVIMAGIFADESAAVRAAAGLEKAQPSRYRHVLFISLPEGADSVAQWTARLREHGARVLVENPAEEKSIVAFVDCQMSSPEAARALAKNLRAYFELPYYLNVRAPWEPPTDAADAERSTRVQATTEIFQEASRQATKHPQLRSKMTELFNVNLLLRAMVDRQAQQKAVRELDAIYTQVRQQIIERLAAERHVQLDEETLELLGIKRGMFGSDLATTGGGAFDFRRLGGFDFSGLNELVAKAADFQPSPLWVNCAAVTTSRQKLSLKMLSFSQITAGLPALLDYLLSKGCTDLRFRLEEDEGEWVD